MTINTPAAEAEQLAYETYRALHLMSLLNDEVCNNARQEDHGPVLAEIVIEILRGVDRRLDGLVARLSEGDSSNECE